MQSGYASNRLDTLADAETLGHDFASSVGCTDPAQVLSCMRGKTTAQVLLAFAERPAGVAELRASPGGLSSTASIFPISRATLFENGAFTRVPLIIGATRDKGWIYVDRSFPGG